MVQCRAVALRPGRGVSSAMQAQEFVRKWQAGSPAHALNERAGAQAHFIDLCRVLGVPEPGDPDSYCFERGVAKTGGTGLRTDGFADVWLRGHFAWEYKAPGRSLDGALKQLMMYALPLESPPLLVVSDRLTHRAAHAFHRHAQREACLRARRHDSARGAAAPARAVDRARAPQPQAQQPRHHRRSRAHLCRHGRAAARRRRGARTRSATS